MNINDYQLTEMSRIAKDAIAGAYRLGKQDGLERGQIRLDRLSGVVLKSVTKQWLLDEIKRQAEALRQEAK